MRLFGTSVIEDVVDSWLIQLTLKGAGDRQARRGKLKAVILAAGEGSRMRPLTYTRPKVMLPIANKPILEHLLTQAIRAGIKEFIFIVGYRDEQVRHYFGRGDQWGVNIGYSTQRKQLGTADALRLVRGLVDGNFLVLNGDIIASWQDITSLAANSGNTMSVVEVEETRI